MAEAAQLYCPEVVGWDQSRLMAAVRAKAVPEPNSGSVPRPDFAFIHAELQQH